MFQEKSIAYLLGKIDPGKVVMGISNFGRQYTVAGEKTKGVLGEKTETNTFAGPFYESFNSINFYEV
jgi:hypothetical protein